MIRNTLAATKAATFCVSLPDLQRPGLTGAVGTGFFVSADGLFATARHVIVESPGPGAPIRGDLNAMNLVRPGPSRQGAFMSKLQVQVVGDDMDCDFALLKIEQDSLWGKIDEIPTIGVTGRLLDEGEPVYAFGYPLSQSLDLSNSPGINAPPGVVSGTNFSPRVTSAIISSQVAVYRAISYGKEPSQYAIDRALNFGNSGGPIIASTSGKAFAICSAFQHMFVPQPHLSASLTIMIMMPSLYGVVTSLANPPIVKILTSNGVPIHDD